MENKKTIFALILVSVLVFVAYTQLTLFIVAPIGAVPEGKTVVILRLNETNFIDSPDGMCERLHGGVSLLCRGMMLSDVVNKSKIIVRLPYSESLYLLSTNGKTYSR
jgi:hypothetical protein